MQTRLQQLVNVAYAVIVCAILLSIAPAASKNPTPKIIYDVSWPNCQATPPPAGSVGIVGITGGLDFHQNPCLTQETSWFANYGLYMNTGYPGPNFHLKFPDSPKRCYTDKLCFAYNYGYNAATYAINDASRQNIHSNTWWLDVETVNSWTLDPAENVASLQGMVAAIRHYTVLPRIGFYSATNQWAVITGSWHSQLPAWLATGSLLQQTAIAACTTPSFTGTPLQLTQYTSGLDQNYVCNSNDSQTIFNR